MKLNHLIFLCTFLNIAYAHAQSYYKVNYHHHESNYDFEGEFLFNADEAVYKVKEDREAGYSYDEVKLQGVRVYEDTIYKATYSNSTYSIERIRLLGKLFITKRNDTINWDIDLRKEKQILGFLCYKATTNYYGRNYTAWFTFDIPTTYSPYSFNGLPGLILEINDHFGDFSFLAYEIRKTNIELIKNNNFLELKNVLLNKNQIITRESYDKKSIRLIDNHINFKIASAKEKFPTIEIVVDKELFMRNNLLFIPKYE